MSQYKFKINGKEFEVAVNTIEGNNASVVVNGINYNVEIEQGAELEFPSEAAATLGTLRGRGPAPLGGVSRSETAEEGKLQVAPSTSTNNTPSTGAGKKIVSPLPGVIIDVCVNVGDAVKRGQKIAVIEAMKMENDILAECDGTVSAIYVKKTDSVLEGADIASIA